MKACSTFGRIYMTTNAVTNETWSIQTLSSYRSNRIEHVWTAAELMMWLLLHLFVSFHAYCQFHTNQFSLKILAYAALVCNVFLIQYWFRECKRYSSNSSRELKINFTELSLSAGNCKEVHTFAVCMEISRQFFSIFSFLKRNIAIGEANFKVTPTADIEKHCVVDGYPFYFLPKCLRSIWRSSEMSTR